MNDSLLFNIYVKFQLKKLEYFLYSLHFLLDVIWLPLFILKIYLSSYTLNDIFSAE